LYFKINAATLLIFGMAPLIVAAVLVAIPRFLRSAQPRNEAEAAANIQRINTAEANYMMSARRYGTLGELVDAGLVERGLLDARAGYQLRVEAQEVNYVVLASAIAPYSGRYDYYSFADGRVRYSSDPRRSPPGLPAAPVQ